MKKGTRIGLIWLIIVVIVVGFCVLYFQRFGGEIIRDFQLYNSAKQSVTPSRSSAAGTSN
jgi:TRAP-type mannitol/chloroaromatic compound transport system permease small subunit